MFREINLSEAVYSGNVAPGGIITFDRVLAWIKNVNNSAKAKYLKCIIGTSTGATRGVMASSITDIKATTNVLHRNVTYKDAVNIYIVDGDMNDKAITLKQVVDAFLVLEKTFIKNKIDPKTVQVFCVDENKPNKPSRFCWFYDDSSDTAVIVKNMNPGAAAAFLRSGEAFVQKLARTPNNPERIQQQLQALAAQETSLAARLAANRAKFEKLKAQASQLEPEAPVAPVAPVAPAAPAKKSARKLKRPPVK